MSWSFFVASFLLPPLTSPLWRLKYPPQESILKVSHSVSFSEQTELLLPVFNALQNPGVHFIYCTFFNKENVHITGKHVNIWKM
jgi:hypothetical protein